MLTSLKITKWSTSAINVPTDRRLASQDGRILVDPYSPARPAKVSETMGAWARKVCRPPYFRSPYPPKGVGAPRARPGGYGWPRNPAVPRSRRPISPGN